MYPRSRIVERGKRGRAPAGHKKALLSISAHGGKARPSGKRASRKMKACGVPVVPYAGSQERKKAKKKKEREALKQEPSACLARGRQKSRVNLGDGRGKKKGPESEIKFRWGGVGREKKGQWEICI